jgi:hypothetical protein
VAYYVPQFTTPVGIVYVAGTALSYTLGNMTAGVSESVYLDFKVVSGTPDGSLVAQGHLQRSYWRLSGTYRDGKSRAGGCSRPFHPARQRGSGRKLLLHADLSQRELQTHGALRT